MKSLWYKIEAGSEWKQVQQIQSSERHGFNVKHKEHIDASKTCSDPN